MHGFYGRILKIDLDAGVGRIEPLDDDFCKKHLGGKSLATRLLLDLNPPGVDPLAPENHFIVATGPFAQSRIWGACRYGIFTKSPLTGLYSESYAGGKVPEAVDSAGFDAVVVRGRAARPTVLAVHPDGCEFHDAGALWGMDTFKAEDEINARFAPNRPGYGRSGTMVIGPAGENLVRFACIENDYWRSAGRTGVGAVLGSKNVKGIVFQGDRKRTMADPAGLADYTNAFAKTAKDNPGVKAYKNRGTTMMVAILNKANGFPTKYWSAGTMEGWEKIGGDNFHAEHDVKPHACLKCLMACGRMATIKKGRHAGLVIEGPEYETIYAFGGLCLIDDIGEIAWLNDICDRLGLDTITAGNLCAFTIEARKRGKTDFPIDYNDPDGAAELLKIIAARQGIGELLAQGIVPAAKAWGLEDLAVHVKGMEPAGYDPRTFKGMGLAYATSDRGACHLRTTFYKPELAGISPSSQLEGKAEILVDYEDRLALFDQFVLCRFYRDLYPWEELATLANLVTGLDLTIEDLRARGALAVQLAREFNVREGLTQDGDRLPARLMREPLPTGQAISEADMGRLLEDYYRIRGWKRE